MAGKASVSSVRRLIADFARYGRGRILAGFLLIFLGSFLEAVGLVWLVAALRLIIAPGGPEVAALEPIHVLLRHVGGEDRQVLVALSSFACLVLVRAALLSVRDSYLARLQFNFVETARAQTLTAIGKAKWQAISQTTHGQISQAIIGDVQEVGVAANSLMLCSVAAITLLASAAIAVLLSAKLALAASIASFGLLMVVPFIRRAGALGVQLRCRRQHIAERILQLLAGLKSAKAQRLDAIIVEDIKAASAEVVQAQLAFVRLQSSTRNLWSVLGALVGISSAAIGLLVLRVDPTIVIAFLLLAARATGPAVTLHQGLHQIFECAGAFDALCDLRARLAVVPQTEIAGCGAPGPVPGGLSLRDVCYLHRGTEGVRGVTIDIPEGAFWGVAGLSGAGKTTFVDILAGILEPQSGQILREGLPLRGALLEAHQRGLSYVGQSAVLFGQTLRHALNNRAAGVSREALDAALHLTGAEELVHRLPGGFDCAIGARDAPISSGERQRLAIACAVLRRPTLLILDEATNALDLESEAHILRALAALRPRPITLIIAHRPHGLAQCERVLVFREGRLCGSDTAQERAPTGDDRYGSHRPRDNAGDVPAAQGMGAPARKMDVALARHCPG